MEKINFIENEAFDKIINIELFNSIINFIVNTTDIDSHDFLKNIKEKNIWFKNECDISIQNRYEIEYFGELLERYEQKIGNDIKDIRAIALSLAYAKDLITENMITGTQLVDFIIKIKELAEKDIYLKGALFLYDNNKYLQYSEDLLNMDYTNTEDILFTFSLFENKEEVFESFRDKLSMLLGKYKTISPINNIKIYAWIIDKLYILINKKRKKDIEVLKALVSIPTSLIKEESNEYKILIANNYSKEEIVYLNYAILYYSHIPKTVRLGNSIVEEKIVINFCKVLINSDKEHEESIYSLIEKIINRYNRFDIKCAGNQSLKQAISEEINIVNPITFINLHTMFNDKIFRFNILEGKWDILAKKMNQEEYMDLFDRFIYYNDFTKEKLENSIKKYNELTQSSYLKTFFLYHYKRTPAFNKLVDNNVISLKDFYNTYENSEKENNIDIQHLREYVSGIKRRNAFLFLEYILEDKKYPITKIDELNFNLKELYNYRSYYQYNYTEINIKKDFLSEEENKKLFFWLDNYIFRIHPNNYIKFIECILKSDNLKSIISKEQLREIFLMLIKSDQSFAKDTELRNRYLTEAELHAIKEKEEKEKEMEKLEKIKKKQEKVVNDFNKISKNTFEELYDFCYKYKWDNDEWKVCWKLVKIYIHNNIKTFELNNEQVIQFIELMTLFIEKKAINIEEFKEFILKYLKEEDLCNGITIRAC